MLPIVGLLAVLVGVHPASPRVDTVVRGAAGDSAAVAVAFSATGGSITSAGLYTAGVAPGAYRVIATARGLADTAVVTLAAQARPQPKAQIQPQAVRAVGQAGIPFGAAQ